MDLKTKYLGLTLKSPLVVSASPLSEYLQNIKMMEDAGAGAIVLHSLFEEQIRNEEQELHYHTTMGTESFAESLSYFPDQGEFKLGPEEYISHISKAKESVSIPIIASLNGSTIGGWTEYAKEMEKAGADAIELNVYYIPTDMELSGANVEQTYIDILRSVKSSVKIPVSIKLSPYF